MESASKQVSKATISSYEKRFNGLMKRFSKETGLSMPYSTYEFLRWADQLASKLSNATRRQYRSAIKYCLREYKINFDEVVPDFLRSDMTRAQVRSYHGKRTSALKSKFIRPTSLTQLLNYLESSRSKSAWLVRDILIASSYFGLRPIEWMNATWALESSVQRGLLVKNAKHSNGRSHGDSRTVWMVKAEEDDDALLVGQSAVKAADRLIQFFQCLNAHIVDYFTADSTASESENAESLQLLQRQEAEVYLTKARQFLSQLYRTNPTLNKQAKRNRITLYSARHQFAANAKKSGLAPEEVAALMGHASMETNQESYGRRVSGVPGGFGVVADQDDVARVLERSPTDNASMSDFGR